MKIYDTLIIGSGYTALGYAIANPNTVIIEERQICDTEFYLPLRCYTHAGISVSTDEGRELYEYYDALGLWKDKMQNLNCFETAFCGYALEHKVEILLKSRVISKTERDDGSLDVRVISPSGIVHIFAKKIIDMRSAGDKKSLTLLFSLNGAPSDVKSVAAAFPDARIEQAFFSDRYALHLNVEGDYLAAKKNAYRCFENLNCEARLIYTAPVLCTERTDCPKLHTDNCFDNPISAFEAGLRFGRIEEGKR